MKLRIKVANFFAKYSTVRWNRVRALRVLCQKAYQRMAMRYIKSSAQHEVSQSYLLGGDCVNTYPWPYRDSNFAAWMEADRTSRELSRRKREDALVVDHLQFVVRHPTSYCAWKIYEQTGRWLRRPAGFQWHARYWQELLATNGFKETVAGEGIKPEHHYVGILPDVGEDGLVVWFERPTMTCSKDGLTLRFDGMLMVSTYLPPNHRYARLRKESGFVQFPVSFFENVVWVKIS